MDLDETDIENRRRRAIYRATYRGFREADLILTPFSQQFCPTMTADDLTTFERLLQVNDHDLYGWIIEREACPDEHKSNILSQIIEFHRTVHVQVRGGQL